MLLTTSQVKWKGLLLFGFCVLFFSYFQLGDGFVDPDSFYHLKMAQLIHEGGLNTEFPWLPFTTLSEHYTNHHFLYHLIVSLFFFFFSPVFAIKLVTVLAASSVVVTFYLLAKRWHFPFPGLLTALLISSPHFLFRLLLTKTIGFSNLFLLLFLFFLFEKRYKSLFILSWLYVWLYGGFVLAIIFVLVFALARFIKAKKHRLRTLISKRSLMPFGLVLMGITLGIVVNPYFPSNLFFYYQQVIEIGLLNKFHEILVGVEWAPYDPKDFLFVNFPVILLLVLTGARIMLTYKKQSFRTIYLLILCSLFLFMTLKSQRYIEYFIPTALLLFGFAWQKTLPFSDWRTFQTWISKQGWFWATRYLSYVYIALILGISFVYMGRVGGFLAKHFSDTYPLEQFAQASTYLKAHAIPGEVIFHSAFDEFPLLFYHNDQNHYILGLDPTFFYNQDKEKYQIWSDIVMGEQQEQIASLIQEQFGASYLLIGKRWDQNKIHLQNDPHISPVYTDDYATIYRITQNRYE